MTAGRPPNVVAIGGGHGLATSIRAVRRYAGRATAIVSVADDGGSSGRLRHDLGIAAPGDIRRCLVAMGDPDSLWGRAFEHRFDAGELKGHALGNVVIAGLAAVTGDFLAAIDEAAGLVGVGDACRVLPATAGPVVLEAEDEQGTVRGQLAVSTTSTGRIRRVSVSPPDAAPPEAALQAVAEADQVVLGPGSLYSSVLAAVAPEPLRRALETTAAQRVYVCNLDTQDQETAGYDPADHVDALLAHGVALDAVLCDPCFAVEPPCAVPVHVRPVAREDGVAHDAARLAGALRDLLG